MKISEIGQMGEQIAADYLSGNGFSIVERNCHVGHQEIDIIAKDDHFLIFAEVKTRSCLYPGSSAYGRPAGAVNREKQENLLLAIKAYLRAHPEFHLQPRIDVIEVYLSKSDPPALLKIHQIRNAFGA